MKPPSSSSLRRLALQVRKEVNRPLPPSAAAAPICLRSFASTGGPSPSPSTGNRRPEDTVIRPRRRREEWEKDRRKRHDGGENQQRRPRPSRGSLPQVESRDGRSPHSHRQQGASTALGRGSNANRPPNAMSEVRPPRNDAAVSGGHQRKNVSVPPRSYVRPSPLLGDGGREETEGQLPSMPTRTPHDVLKDLAGRLVQVQNLLERLKPHPHIWDFTSSLGGGGNNSGGAQGDAGSVTSRRRRRITDSQRAQIAQWAMSDLRSWVKDLRLAVADHHRRRPSQHYSTTAPSRLSLSKHRPELTILIERSMQICADAASPACSEAHDLCEELLELMTTWGLNWQQRHIDAAILAAARVGNWSAAAASFESQIDPDLGNRPVDVDVAEPIGLYALARHWQEETARANLAIAASKKSSGSSDDDDDDKWAVTVVDRVLDAANRMSMLSPTDQESYLLAAGTALGRAGEWRDLVQYLRTSPRADELGQPLVAAAMHACILCDEHEEALQLYDQYVTAQDALLASDWQWAGGESNRLNPLCRDLAMRAMGGVVSGSSSSNKTTTTDGENHVGVSTQALECYWSAMEENVTVSIEALCGVAEACRNDGRWEDAMSVFFSVLTKSFHHRWLVPGSLLSITPVDAENGFHPDVLPSLGPFVGSVLNACNDAGHFATGAIAVSLLQCSLSSIPSAVEPVTNARDLSEMFLPVFEVLHQNSDSLLAASIKSLVQLGCTNESLQLFEAVNEQQVDPATLPESRRLFDSIRQKRTTAMSTTWPLTLAKAHHFITCFQSFVDNEDTVTEKEAKLMASALASLVSAFTAASQSQAGITLATWVDLHTSSNNPYLPMTDALAGSLIDAHSRRKNYKAAVELFSLVPADANHETRLLTYTATIKSLFRLSRASEAVALFETIVKYNRSPDLMSAVASGLLRAGDWSAALDVYRLALAKGCLSEEVGLLAIKSVSVGRVDGRSRIMRNIIDEVSGLSGMSPNDWIELKYWDLKRLIGFGETARLMWWSDFQTRSLFELNFALASQEKRMLDGLTPKNDALRLIASAAKSYQEYHVPEGAVELSYVPRSVSDWKRALTAILAESQHSSLFNSRAFIESVAIGFVELGSFEEATKVIDDAVDRGLDVDRSVLYTARQTATGS